MNNNNETLANIESLLLAQKIVMSIDDLSRYSGISKSTLYKWISARKFPFSKPNNKMIFVRRQDFDGFLLSNPVKPGDDIEAEAINYITSKPWNGGKL